MEFNRTRTHAQRFGDLRAALALADQIQDLALTRRQAVERRILESRPVAKTAARNLRRYIPFAPQHVMNGAVQFFRRRTLGNETMRAGLQCEIGERAVEVQRYNKDT